MTMVTMATVTTITTATIPIRMPTIRTARGA